MSDPVGMRFGDIPSGPAEKTLWLLVYSPNKERALVVAPSRRFVAAVADEIARTHKIQRNGCDIRAATQADLDEAGFVAIVE